MRDYRENARRIRASLDAKPPRFIEVEELIRAKVGGEKGDKFQPLVELWARRLARRGTVIPRDGESDPLSDLLEDFHSASTKATERGNA